MKGYLGKFLTANDKRVKGKLNCPSPIKDFTCIISNILLVEATHMINPSKRRETPRLLRISKALCSQDISQGRIC